MELKVTHIELVKLSTKEKRKITKHINKVVYLTDRKRYNKRLLRNCLIILASVVVVALATIGIASALKDMHQAHQAIEALKA